MPLALATPMGGAPGSGSAMARSQLMHSPLVRLPTRARRCSPALLLRPCGDAAALLGPPAARALSAAARPAAIPRTPGVPRRAACRRISRQPLLPLLTTCLAVPLRRHALLLLPCRSPPTRRPVLTYCPTPLPCRGRSPPCRGPSARSYAPRCERRLPGTSPPPPHSSGLAHRPSLGAVVAAPRSQAAVVRANAVGTPPVYL